MSSDDTVPSVRYLDPVYHELAQLRAEVQDTIKDRDEIENRLRDSMADADQLLERLQQAEARVDQLTDALYRRTKTQNATGEANDALVRRAIAAERTIELARDLAETWTTIDPEAHRTRMWAGEVLREVLGQ